MSEQLADQTPSVSGLPALISESAAVGTPTELVEDGDRSLASPVVGRTAYRMVREGLTNARKHAPGSRVLVQVSYGESEVRVTVTNTHLCCPNCCAAVTNLFPDDKVEFPDKGAVQINGKGLDKWAVLDVLRKAGFNGTVK